MWALTPGLDSVRELDESVSLSHLRPGDAGLIRDTSDRGQAAVDRQLVAGHK